MSKHVKCKKCGVKIWVSKNREIILCEECKTKLWYKREMKKGCNVEHPKNLGRIPHMTLKRKKDLPKVVADGERYVDITEYCFYDTRYKKEYLTDEQIAKKEREYVKKLIGGTKVRGSGAKQIELTEKQRKDILKWYNDRYSYTDIAYLVGVSTNKVNTFLKNERKEGRIKTRRNLRPGIERSINRYTEKEEREILAMYEDGLSHREIGKVLGRTEKAIANKINRMIHEEGRLDA